MKTLLLILALYSTTSISQTLDSVKAYINQTDLQHKEIVLSQSIEETGWYNCTNCSLDRNNLFGWYYKKKYLEFDTWQESIDYYVRWQKRHYKGGDYYEFLKKVGFATNPNYIRNLKRIKK